MSEQECRYPCGCDQFPEEHCSCMDGHTRCSRCWEPWHPAGTACGSADLATPPEVEILACEFYGVVMQSTYDQWTLWQHADQQTRAGFYDLAYEMAERLRPLMHIEALRDAAQAFPHGELSADPTVPAWLRRRADILEPLAAAQKRLIGIWNGEREAGK